MLAAGPETPWHAQSADEVARSLGSDPRQGLTETEAARRLARDGPNRIAREAPVRPLAIFARQFASVVIWVLIVAGGVSALLGEWLDGAAILSIVFLNAAVGFFQEFRAENAMAALARLTAPHARVFRDGRSVVVPADAVVRGDLLVLDAGDLVGADARLLEAESLRADEAPLTGESEPVDKRTDALPADAALADRRNLVFLATRIVAGSGRALVVATGMGTELGRISRLLAGTSREATPLQRKLDVVGRQLLWASLAIVALIFLLGLLRDVAPFELFLGSVSLAVAAIPEGLPAVVSVALALGVERMGRRHALIRRLPSVETLGSAQVICTDKTGTLTVGAMTVRRLVTSEASFAVSGEGYALDGEIFREPAGTAARSGDPVLDALLHACVACNDAELTERDGASGIVGDPTEAALLVVAAKAGLQRDTIERAEPRLRVLPFDPARKRMSVVRRRDGEAWAFVKGAPEVILERCTRLRVQDGTRPLTSEQRAALRQAVSDLAGDGLRVIALAERRLADPDEPEIEQDLTFLGLTGMQDPPRPEVRTAVARCHAAGIRTVMITGDHRETAAAIARELGILRPGDEVADGREIDVLDDAALAARVPSIAVYARVAPEHKLRIVRAWKRRGAVVAMTGDGVNDAPALREAAIGIAMGVAGTEVAKEASDMILTDDDFASIVAAVEEGRGIFDNIAKTLSYLLAGNAGELMVVLGATLLGDPLPLLPLQLLWINLMTDGLPALALATDPIDPDVLARPPRRADEALASRSRLATLALTGLLTAGVSLGAFLYELGQGAGLADARDAAFSTLVVAELLRAFGARSETKLVSELGLFSNLRLFAIVAASFLLQLGIHHSAFLRDLFGITPVSVGECLTWIALGSVPLAVLELVKLGRRKARGAVEPA